MNNNTNTEAREIDMNLAELWAELYKSRSRLASYNASMLSYAGAKWYYRGRQRVTDMRLDEAAAYCDTLMTAHADASDYARFDLEPAIKSNASMGDVRRVVNGREEMLDRIAAIEDGIDVLEAEYTGWSRFFLVTSSAGHIHSSMHCSTCRPTTTYGWLPELSGKDADTAVAELGPTLCSVCYPDAPTEWTTGRKLTAAKAAKLTA